MSEEDNRDLGEASGFGCPDCGGALWEIHNGAVVQYRCRVGHAFSDESLLAAQNEGLERAMWTALRALEGMATQAQRLGERMTERGHPTIAARFHAQAKDAEERAAIIRRALLRRSSEEQAAKDAG